MGCEGSKLKSGTTADNNLIALVMLDDTEAIVRRTKSMGPSFNINDKVNVRGDTLLHYAAKRNNYTLIRHLLSQPGVNAEPKNDLGKTPKDLAPADSKPLFP
jgi:ankyrin repeat protein